MANEHSTGYAGLGKGLEDAKDGRTNLNQQGSNIPILKKYWIEKLGCFEGCKERKRKA
jgi:hypothetical protein